MSARKKVTRGATAASFTGTAKVEFSRSVPTGSNNSTTVLHKDLERQTLAQLLEDFQRRGGSIQVLGTSAIRPSLSRRQINEANAQARNKRQQATGASA